MTVERQILSVRGRVKDTTGAIPGHKELLIIGRQKRVIYVADENTLAFYNRAGNPIYDLHFNEINDSNIISDPVSVPGSNRIERIRFRWTPSTAKFLSPEQELAMQELLEKGVILEKDREEMRAQAIYEKGNSLGTVSRKNQRRPRLPFWR